MPRNSVPVFSKKADPDLIKILSRCGLRSQEVIRHAVSDLDSSGNYRKRFLCLTRQELVLLPEETDPTPADTDTAGKLLRFSVEAISELKADTLVGAGVLLGVREQDGDESVENGPSKSNRGDGHSENDAAEKAVTKEEFFICRFSNSRAREFAALCRAFRNIKKGEPEKTTEPEQEEETLHCPKCGRAFPDRHRQVCPKCVDKRSLFLRLLLLFPQYKRQLITIFILMLISSAFKLLNPFLGGKIFFDQVLTPGGRFYGMVIQVVLIILVSQIAAQMLAVIYGRINAKITSRIVFQLKTGIFEAMEKLSMSFFSRKQTGGLLTRVNWDTMQLQYFFIDGMPYFVVNTFLLIGVGIAMFLLHWKLALLVFIPAPVVILTVKYLFPKIWNLHWRFHRARRKLTAHVNDALSGVREVKAFGKEGEEVHRFHPANEGVYSTRLAQMQMSSTVFPLTFFLMQVGGLIVWSFGGLKVLQGDLTLGILWTFIGYITMLYQPLRFMTMIVDWWSSCMNAAQRVFEILDARPDIRESENPVRLKNIKGKITLENVTFAYEPNRPVLHGINITADPGKMIGLVGHTGAGKSTITNLITRLYDTLEGTVKIDGHDVRSLASEDLRRGIGIVLQETYLFSGTIAENVAYSRPDASREQIIAAAKAAQAHDFITELPDGYDTMLGRKGHDLSGGERQRISIARAILRDPKILIFDEATSSVDTETEEKIQKAIQNLIKGRTTIAIAHRLSTLRHADTLYIVEKGKIIEEGTHEKLMDQEGKYYELVQRERKALKVIGVAQ